MVKEIYTRNEKDPYYEDKVIDYSNEVESIISKVRMILGTSKGDVLGEPDFGSNIEDVVFNTKQSANKVRKDIDDQIQKYIPFTKGLSISTEVNFGHSDNGTDYAVIDIFINGKKSVGFLVNKE